jgi:Trk K+ transport system NAD-binding subunit
MLFVLLAADTRVQEVLDLGVPGLLTVAALMFVVRPLNVVVGTWGSDLTWRERTFLAWLAPRGIVAAAVASLFAQSLDAAGIQGGAQLRALVFLVIAVTVALQGLSGGVVARLLGVSRGPNRGYMILGAGDLGRALARELVADGESVVLIDSNHTACREAEDEGLRVLHGSGLDERVLMRAGADSRAGCVAVTPNEEINLLFAKHALEEVGIPQAWLALRKGHMSVRPEMAREAGARVLFGAPRSLEFWTLRLERGTARIESWIYDDPRADVDASPAAFAEDGELHVLPIALRRRGRVEMVDDRTEFKRGDVVILAVHEERRAQAETWFAERGFAPVADAPATDATPSGNEVSSR